MIMDNRVISGYTGLFKQPITNLALYGPTIYAVSDIDKKELDLIILTPHCFYDAHKIIKYCGFPSIRIFCPAIDYLFISDIALLLKEFSKYDGVKDVKLVFPEKIKIPISSDISSHIIISSEWKNRFCPYIDIAYMQTLEDVPHMFYDIAVMDGESTKYFSLNFTQTKLQFLFSREENLEIHTYYNDNHYNIGMNYFKIKELYKDKMNMIFAHTFSSDAEYRHAVESGVKIGKSISSALSIGGVRGVLPYDERVISNS